MLDHSTIENALIGEIHELLRRLSGVIAARAKTKEDESGSTIAQIHILADTSREVSDIENEVQSALFAVYGIDLEKGAIVVTQIAGSPIKRKTPEPPDTSNSRRARYKGLDIDEGTEAYHACVRLEFEGVDYSGEADAPKEENGQLRAIAEATLNSVSSLLGEKNIYMLVATQKVKIAGVMLVVSMVQCLKDDGRIFTGTAKCGAQELQGAVRATLNAINRNIIKRLE